MRAHLIRAHIALFMVNTLYGASHIIAKGVMPNYLTPNVFIMFRAVGATLLFWLIKLILIKEKVLRKDMFLFAICGMFGVTINQLFFFNGLNLSSSINSGIIMTLNPIMVVILSFFIIRSPINIKRTTGVLIGATGAILLTLSSGTASTESLIGDLYLLINAASYALYLGIAKPLINKYSPLTVITYVFSFGMLFILIYPPTLTEFLSTDFKIITSDVIWKILYVVIGVTFLTYLLTMYGLKHTSPTVSSAYIYTQPVSVIFFAYILSEIGLAEDYTDTITLEKIIYMLIIFVGVYITSSTSFVNHKNDK